MNKRQHLVLLLSLLSLPAATASAAEEFPAVLAWSQRAVLSAPVSGVLGKVAVSPGQQVEEGQPLLQFDQRPFESAVRDAQAQVHKHRLLRAEAMRELERTRELYERTVISSHDLQLAEIAYAVADSDYTSAVADLDKANLHLEYSSLRAPFAGIVLEVPVTAGMTVINTQQATPLVTLARHRPMHALAQVPGVSAGGVSTGQAASVIVNGNRYAGTLTYRSAEPDSSGVYTLTFAFDPGQSVLGAGLPARVEIE